MSRRALLLLTIAILVLLLVLALYCRGLVRTTGPITTGPTPARPGPPPSSAVKQIAGGAEHTCALLQSGDVHCWGSAFNAQLGYANTDAVGDDETPASVGPVNVGAPVSQVATGAAHTCALLQTGTVRCWGLGGGGRLGYAKTDMIGDDETPASAGDVDVGGTVTEIVAGGVHTCALLDGGAVRCWGANSSGELGYGHTDRIGDDEVPASAGNVNVGGTVTQLAVGGNHTCALLTTGAVRCWGLAFNGQLGYGNTDRIGDDETPASAGDVDVGGSVKRIAAAGNNTCVLLTNGAVRCWGAGSLGQLGYANTLQIGDDETPASAGDVDVGGLVARLSVGSGHVCALLQSGPVRCWGDGSGGRLGYGNADSIGDDETPASAGNVDVGATVTEIAAAGQHTCALLDTARVRCWGFGGEGALGYADTVDIGDDESPATAGDVQVP